MDVVEEQLVQCECLWEPTFAERVIRGDGCSVHPNPDDL